MKTIFLVLVMSILGHADDLIMKDGKKIEWKSIVDAGEKYEVETKDGQKISVKKDDVERFSRGQAALPLTGASFTFDKTRKLQTADLLRAVEAKRDLVSGEWKASAQGLRGTGIVNGLAKIGVPYAPPEEYDLTITAEMKDGTDCELFVGLIGGNGKQFHVNFNGITGSWNGFGLIGGKMQDNNDTGVPGKAFQKGQARTFTIMVRKDGVICQMDGKDYLAWRAEWDKVSVFPAFAVPDKTRFFLGVGNGSYLISRMTLSSPKP